MNKKLSPEDAFYENLTLGLIRTLCKYIYDYPNRSVL